MGIDKKRPDIKGFKLCWSAAVYLDMAELKPHMHTEKAIPHKGVMSCSIPIPYAPIWVFRNIL